MARTSKRVGPAEIAPRAGGLTMRVIAWVSGQEFTMEEGPELDRRLALDVNDPECVRIDDRREQWIASMGMSVEDAIAKALGTAPAEVVDAES